MNLNSTIELCHKFSADPGTVDTVRRYVIPRLERELSELQGCLIDIHGNDSLALLYDQLNSDAVRVAQALAVAKRRLAGEGK